MPDDFELENINLSNVEDIDENDYENKGSGIAQYKKSIILFAVAIVAIAALVILRLLDIIPLSIANAVILPVFVVVLILYMKNKPDIPGL